MIAAVLFGGVAWTGFAQAADCSPCSPVVVPPVAPVQSEAIDGTRSLTLPDSASTTDSASGTLKFGLRDAVTRARTMLEAHLTANKPKKPKTVASKNAWVDVTLAVWSAATGDIRLVPVKKNGTQIREADDADITVARTNGINSEYVLSSATEDSYVVGIEYPIFTKTKKGYELNDVVYVPYSQKLQVPEMVAWGETTLDGYIADVLSELRDKGIKSRAYPDRLLADVIDPHLIKAIVFIEHAGDKVMISDPKGTTEAIQVVLAANQDSAYSYSVSTAGARGLVQFIPSTYKLVAARKNLGLNPNFVAGMSDPHNAIKAEVALLDSELAGMPAAVRASSDIALIDAYLAAAYNGGGYRVRKAIAAFGDGWADSHAAELASLQKQYDTLFAQATSLKKKILAEDNPKVWKPLQAQLNASRAKRASVQARMNVIKASSLRAETAGYVKKLNAVLGILKPDNTSVAVN